MDDYSLNLTAASSQYASIADGSQTGLNPSAAITMEAWVWQRSVGTSYTIMSKGEDSGDDRSYSFDITATGLRLFVSQSGTQASRDNLAVTWTQTTGKWNHVAVTWLGSSKEAKFYVNGVQQGATQTGSNAASLFNNASPFAIGSVNVGTTPVQFADHLVKDARVWSDVRTVTEIADNMALKTLASTTGLVGRWLFDNDLLDETANNNDLTASGSPTYLQFAPHTFENLNTTDWSAHKLTIDNTKVSGSTDLTNYPTAVIDGNFIADLYTNIDSVNRYSLDLEVSSTQYVYRADTASLSITGDLTQECLIKLEQLPSASTTMVIAAK